MMSAPPASGFAMNGFRDVSAGVLGVRNAFCSGSPRFEQVEFARISASSGTIAAWAAAFRQHGVAAVGHVTGDFAVGIEFTDGSAFAAVDRFAIQSLCYAMRDNRLAFAKRADTLAGPDASIDPQAIFDYLYHHVIPSPRTIFAGIHRLPPGNCVVLREGLLTIHRYWIPHFDESQSAPFAELKKEFIGLLENAVRDKASPASGCFLSGGTDSSTVAGMVCKVAETPARTFSIGFDADGYDEMEYARIAARHFGTEHREYYLTPADLVAAIPKVAASYDQPFGNSSVLPAYFCAKIAREAGVDRMLGGDGGDELFGGNSRYAKQKLLGMYDMIPKSIRSLTLERVFAPDTPVASAPGLKKIVSYIEQARVPMPDRMDSYNLLLRLGVQEMLTPEFLALVKPTEPLENQRLVYAECTSPGLMNRMLAYDWRYTLSETDLPKVVGATALAGVDVAFPLLDQRLLEFSMKLPADYKVSRLRLRWFFKEALRGFLPEEIITKRKQGFGLPFGVWLTKDQGLLAMATDSLRTFSERGIVRPEFIDSVLKRHLPAHPGYYGEVVWILMMMEQWFRASRPDFSLKAS